MSDVGGSVDDSDDNHKHKDDRRPARTGVARLASHGVSSGRCSSASVSYTHLTLPTIYSV